jgi:hypothetical protein
MQNRRNVCPLVRCESLLIRSAIYTEHVSSPLCIHTAGERLRPVRSATAIYLVLDGESCVQCRASYLTQIAVSSVESQDYAVWKPLPYLSGRSGSECFSL